MHGKQCPETLSCSAIVLHASSVLQPFIAMEKKKRVNSGKLFQQNVPWIVFLIFALAFVLRIWGITFGLPGTDHGDESEVVNHAVRFGSGDLNPHRFQYGSLFQYILFVFYGIYFLLGYLLGQYSSLHHFALSFIQDPTVFYLIARVLSAVFGTATLLVIYLMGKRVKDKNVGIVASLFLAFNYQHVIHSHYCTVDITMTFFFTLAVYQCILLFERDDLWRYIVAGLSIGLAMATKLNGVFASIAFLLSYFLKGWAGCLQEKLFCKNVWLGVVAIFVGHFVASPYFYFDLDVSLPEIAQLRSFHTSSDFNLLIYLKEFIKNYWGIPLGALCTVGFFRSLVTTNRKLLVISLTTLIILCFASLHKYVEAKYILYTFPLFALMGSYVCLECFGKLKKRYFSLILMLLLIHPAYLIVNWDYQHAQKSLTLEAKEWIEEHIPVNSKILLDNVGNAGPKLDNSPVNIKRQYQRALKNNLLRADYLKLKLEIVPVIYYNIVQVRCSAGSRKDYFQRYSLWQDLEEIGHPPEYYQKKGYEYIIVTERYFSEMELGFKLIKEFKRGLKSIRVYAMDL